MYTDKELKKMTRPQMLEAMREMNHPYTTKMDAEVKPQPLDVSSETLFGDDDDGSTEYYQEEYPDEK